MNLSFRRNSVTSPDKTKDDEEDSLSKKTSFNFGDMGKNLNFKKIFSDKDKVDLKRSKSGADDNESGNSRIKEIISLLEEFRLQCPPTHAGLVVAFTATTLSPLSDPDIKYKWYRMDKEQDQFLQIDQGSRGWYPPTADDIGKKICAQCEDVFEQGYCRYAETGPVEADPLLRSMLDSALENGSYTMKDVSVSLGVNVLDPEVNAMVVSFDMQAKQRLSALEQSPSPIGSAGFAQFEGRHEVDVDSTGIFLSFFDPEVSSARKGLRLKGNTALTVECALPASLIITVPLPVGERAVVPSAVAVDVETSVGPSDAGEGETAVDAGSTSSPNDGAALDQVGYNEAENVIPWEWVGEKSGTQYEQVTSFFESLGDCVVPEFRVCLACCDRMQRDAMALSIRTLAALGSDASMRERMSILPWIGVEGSKTSVQSMAGSELGTRLKDLENENKALKRERDELNLQIMEHGVESSAQVAESTVTGGEDTGGDDGGGGGRAKIRQLENDILAYRRKEMEVEQDILEKEAQIGRLTSDIETKNKQIFDLEQKLADKTTALAASENAVSELKANIASMDESMKSVSQDKADAEEARATFREMENELVSLRKSLAEAEERYSSQISETRVIAAELLAAQNKASDMESQAIEAAEKCRELSTSLEAEAESKRNLQADYDALLEQKKSLEEAAQAAELYEEALDSIDKLEGERNHWQHKSESLAKDVKRLLKQMEDLHNTTSYQLKESSRALEIRNEEYKKMEEYIASKSSNEGADGNGGGSRRMSSIFGRKGKKEEDTSGK